MSVSAVSCKQTIIFIFIFLFTIKCHANFEEINEDLYRCKVTPHLTFYLERVTYQNKASWLTFVQEIYQSIKNEFEVLKNGCNPKEMVSRCKKFQEDPYSDPQLLRIHRYQDTLPVFMRHLNAEPLENGSIESPSSVWVVYTSTTEEFDVLKKNRNFFIEIAMTVTTSADTPLVMHMGIFRNPLCPPKNKQLSSLLQGFAAQAISRIYPSKKYMFTFLRDNMRRILLTSLEAQSIPADEYYRAALGPQERAEGYAEKEGTPHLLKEFFKHYTTPWKVGMGQVFIISLEALARLGVESLSPLVKRTNEQKIDNNSKSLEEPSHTFFQSSLSSAITCFERVLDAQVFFYDLFSFLFFFYLGFF